MQFTASGWYVFLEVSWSSRNIKSESSGLIDEAGFMMARPRYLTRPSSSHVG